MYDIFSYHSCQCFIVTPKWLHLSETGFIVTPKWQHLSDTGFYFTVTSISIVILIVSSVLILNKARKQAVRRGQTLHWQGVLPVITTTMVFLLSYLPYFIVKSVNILQEGVLTEGIRGAEETIKILSLIYNVMASFNVYSVTVQSFRDFLTSRMLRVARCHN